MMNVGNSAAKLEEQLRSLSHDLQRLTAGLEDDLVAAPIPSTSATYGGSQGVGATIEADSAVEGVYITNGNLRIDGLVKGEIVCRGALLISEQGVVQGVVEASEVVLAGRLEGEVECQGGFVVRTTGWLSGKVRAAEVTIQDGAYYAGELHLHNQRAEESSPRSVALLELLERRKGAGLSVADLKNDAPEVAGEAAAVLSAGLGSSLFKPMSDNSWEKENELGAVDTVDDSEDSPDASDTRTLAASKAGGSN
jgi:cytoskeletal protein CcmA (bactofilin family)